MLLMERKKKNPFKCLKKTIYNSKNKSNFDNFLKCYESDSMYLNVDFKTLSCLLFVKYPSQTHKYFKSKKRRKFTTIPRQYFAKLSWYRVNLPNYHGY